MTPGRAVALLLGAPVAAYLCSSALTYAVGTAYWKRTNMTDTPRATWGGLVAGARAERPTFAQAAPTHTAVYGPRECAGCAFHQNQRRISGERYDTAQERITALEVENTELRAAVNGTSVTRAAADFAALERRMHRLAGEEADARGELADKTNELQRALADVDRAERTAENLRIRMLAAGITP